MSRLQLVPRRMNLSLLHRLERRGLIMVPRPSRKLLCLKEGTDAVERLSLAARGTGAHMIIAVAKNITAVTLTYHTDHEELILLNGTGLRYKPLYLIVGLCPPEEMRRKVRTRTLRQRDILAVELVYNDPRLSFFTVLKNTVHCEITAPGNRGRGPVFFVSEPSAMRMDLLDISPYEITLRTA